MAPNHTTKTDPAIQLARAVLDDDNSTMEEVKSAMLEFLRPGNGLERLRANELAKIEVEITQHRRLRDALVLAEAQAAAAALFVHGDFTRVSRGDHPEAWRKATELFFSDCPRSIANAEEHLATFNLSRLSLIAQVYRDRAESFASQDKVIGTLEKRRRELLDDFEVLRVAAPRAGFHHVP